jgi:hypothetical protein
VAHPLAFRFTSQLVNDVNGTLFDDIDGLDLDLRNIDEATGSLDECTQGGRRISGHAKPLTGQEPLKFRLRYRNPTTSTRHRGFAVQNSAGEITKLVGAIIAPAGRIRAEDAGDDDKALADQTEATWVATKGG